MATTGSELALAHSAQAMAFAVSVDERVAEVHDALRVRAMSEAQGMAELVDRLLQRAHALCLAVRSQSQPAQRDHRGAAMGLGHAEDKTEGVRIEVRLGNRQHLAARITQ